MKTLEQILKKIENEKQTLSELKENASRDKTITLPNQWYTKQIAVIENRIDQLQWVIENDKGTSKKILIHKINEEKIDEFLEQSGYISKSEKQLINLKWVLEAYCKYIKANK